MGTLKAFEFLSPILPDLPWILTGLISTLAPAIGFLIIQYSIQETRSKKRKLNIRNKKTDPAVEWVGVAIVSVLLVFFSFGYFGVQPTVINSGSMRSAIDVGDIVILTEVSAETIQKGDIIQYKWKNFSTIHRVHDIYGVGGNKIFITKGDANEEPDVNPVSPGQITGKAFFIIPKIGWIPIVIKDVIQKISSNI